MLFKENLNAGTMIDYQVLPWLDDQIEKYCYDNDPANCETYGALYHWWEAMYYGLGLPGAQGICPTGFHIPTDQEYTLLTELYGGFVGAGGTLKATEFWDPPNTGATMPVSSPHLVPEQAITHLGLVALMPVSI